MIIDVEKYGRKNVIKFLQMQEDMPQLFLSRDDSLNGEFWGPDDLDEEQYYAPPPHKGKRPEKPFNDNLKSDNW